MLPQQLAQRKLLLGGQLFGAGQMREDRNQRPFAERFNHALNTPADQFLALDGRPEEMNVKGAVAGDKSFGFEAIEQFLNG